MKLDFFLKESGWSRSDIARALGLTRGALTKWDDVPERWESLLHSILVNKEVAPKIVRKCSPMDLPDDEMEAVIRTRSSVSDWDICQERGWRIHELNAAIAAWVRRNSGGVI